MVRLLNGNLTGAPPCYPTEIEHVAPAAAAPAPEPFAVIPPRTVDAQRWPVVVMERAEGGPASAPVEAHRHPAGRAASRREVYPYRPAGIPGARMASRFICQRWMFVRQR